MPSTPNTSDSKKRKRDADATRSNIMDAAKLLFCQKGYDGASTRDIANHAGVNAALINRYFGSKKQLFAQTILPTLTFSAYLEGEKSEFGWRVANAMQSKVKPDGYHAMKAVLLSAASIEVCDILRETLESQFLTALIAYLDGNNVLERARLIATQIAGYDLTINILGVGTMNENSKRLLAQTLQNLIDG